MNGLRAGCNYLLWVSDELVSSAKRKLDHLEAADVWFSHALAAGAAGAPYSADEFLQLAADHERAAYDGCDPLRCFVYHDLFRGD
jgi:DNA helicase HerA-like ATPase